MKKIYINAFEHSLRGKGFDILRGKGFDILLNDYLAWNMLKLDFEKSFHMRK